MAMNPVKKAQIKAQTRVEAQIGALIFDKALIVVLIEYSGYNNVFSVENVTELLELTRMNNHAIKLEKSKQIPFESIYNLEPVELKILKTYIKTSLTNGFIQPSKSPAGALILFDQKSDKSFCLCVDYWGLNNITIKNQYLLPLIGELLDKLDWAKRFL